LISVCFSPLVHLQHSFRQEGQEVVHYVRFFLFRDEIASGVFGQAGHHLGGGLGEFVLGVELLQLRSQAGARVGSSLMSRIQGLQAWEPFAFYPAVSSDGVPRAVKRAS